MNKKRSKSLIKLVTLLVFIASLALVITWIANGGLEKALDRNFKRGFDESGEEKAKEFDD